LKNLEPTIIVMISFPRLLACSQRSDEKDTENQLEAVQYQRFCRLPVVTIGNTAGGKLVGLIL
jgi:hypothetical protein